MSEASLLLVEDIMLYCFAAILFIITTLISGFLSTWLGLLSNGVGLFSGERVLENTPTFLFEQPVKFIAHER